MNFKEMGANELRAIILSLAELHQWEQDNSSVLSSMTGRHLYYKIAERAIGERSLLSGSLKKDLYAGSHLSEKAIRLRMRELEQEGCIEAISSMSDARAKYLVPTEKFYESIYHHAEQTRRILSRYFHLIGR
jgi:hypothetical protein